MSHFSDHEPGNAPLERRWLFEEWAEPDDQHIAVLLDGHRTAEGRVLQAGDIVTPRQARAERMHWRYVEGKTPHWNPALQRWEVGEGPPQAGRR